MAEVCRSTAFLLARRDRVSAQPIWRFEYRKTRISKGGDHSAPGGDLIRLYLRSLTTDLANVVLSNEPVGAAWEVNLVRTWKGEMNFNGVIAHRVSQCGERIRCS